MKIGDSLIRDDEGSLISIEPDTFFEVDNRVGYWQLLPKNHRFQILRVLFI